MNVGSLLPRHARFRPDHAALVVGDQRMNYHQLNLYVNRLANALLTAGLSKGDKLATVLPNCLELMAAYWASGKTGIVIVPASPMLQDAGLRNVIGDSDTSMVIGHSSFADAFDRIRGELPGVAEDRYILVGNGGDRAGFRSYDEFLAAGSDDEPPAVSIDDDDVFNIMYSSGTTGEPKGIVHTHYVRAMYCMVYASTFRILPESIVLHAGSIVFNGALVDMMPWMFTGATYILHESFDPERVIETIHRERVSHIIMVPSQIVAVLESPAFAPEKLASLEMLHNVGAPLLLEHKQRINEQLHECFYELYGVTEGFMTVLDKHDAVRKLGSVGCPIPFTEIRVLSEDGGECAPGEVGEICGRGPMLMPGYYKRPDLTAESLIDGWFHSGDAGYLDDDGYLYLVDRIKDMIISGGVNVYPRDIEEIIIQHPAIREVAVFGATDETWGEIPVAAVLLDQGSEIDVEELIEWTNRRVAAKYQRIRDVVIYEEFPRNVAGKTLKRQMRDTYVRK